MKNVFRVVLVVVLCGFGMSAFAATKVVNIPLYTDANKNSKVLEQLPIGTQLIPIFRHDNWVKVGDPRNGHTGWIDYTDYLQAQSQTNSNNTQVIYVQTNNNGKQKSENIIAYQNGKKLSDAQAKALYEKVQKQQQVTNDQFMKMQQQMNAMFMHNMQMWQPIVIVNQDANLPAKKK